MGVSENWPVPSRETYEWIVYLFQFFPLVRYHNTSKTQVQIIYTHHIL